MTISYYEKIGDDVRCIDEEIPFDIPDTWEWVRLENCCSKEIRRGKSPKYTERSGALVFAQKCNTKYNGIDVGLALYLDEDTLSRYPADEYMQDGDVVVNSTGTGTLGRVGIYCATDNHLGLPIVPDSRCISRCRLRTSHNVNYRPMKERVKHRECFTPSFIVIVFSLTHSNWPNAGAAAVLLLCERNLGT